MQFSIRKPWCFCGPLLQLPLEIILECTLRSWYWPRIKWFFFFKKGKLHKSWLIPSQVCRITRRNTLVYQVLPRPKYEKNIRPKYNFFFHRRWLLRHLKWVQREASCELWKSLACICQEWPARSPRSICPGYSSQGSLVKTSPGPRPGRTKVFTEMSERC